MITNATMDTVFVLNPGSGGLRSIVMGLITLPLPNPPYPVGGVQLIYHVATDIQAIHLYSGRVLKDEADYVKFEAWDSMMTPAEIVSFERLTPAVLRTLTGNEVIGIEGLIAEYGTADEEDELQEYYRERFLTLEYRERMLAKRAAGKHFE